MEISNELLSAYAEGNVSEAERNAVRQYLTDHPEELENILIMMDKDYDIQIEEIRHSDHSETFNQELDDLLNDIDLIPIDVSSPTSLSVIPIMSKAAQNNEDNLCAIRCEAYALRTFGIKITDEELEEEAKGRELIKPDGTLLHNIGQLSAKYGLYVSRRYECKINDIIKALKYGDIVIAVIDNTELSLRPEESKRQDELYGKIPNHAVIVKSIDIERNRILLLNPGTSNETLYYPLDVFVEAWNDSSNCLIISNRCHYKPHPINLSRVTLDGDIIELQEVFAENVHEVWAKARIDDGWKYGPILDDSKKTDPCLLPYDLLPEQEKKYCRLTALNSIKCLKKLGWSLVKKEKNDKLNGHFENHEFKKEYFNYECKTKIVE